jgi:UDP-2-acetamido-3-amino-2,3-dideoxy-glucuronate N-acetyltransferase
MLGLLGPRITGFPALVERPTSIVRPCTTRGVELYELPEVHERRGDLSVAEFDQDLPFAPKRYFLVHNVPVDEVRGQHAHRVCEQFLICVSGSVTVELDDGQSREEIRLDAPNLGLYVPPRIWAAQRDFSAGGVLLVFASHAYEPKDYIRSYEQFYTLCRSPVPSAA